MCRFIQIEDQETIDNLDEIMENLYDGYIRTKRLHDNGKYVGIASDGCTEETIKHWSRL